MPFQRPTPPQIRDRLSAEIESALPGADARTRRSVEGTLVRAVSVASYALHEHLDWVSQQILVDTAEAEILERHASIWGIERRAANPATGTITFTGSIGSVIPAGSELRRADDTRYVTTADVTFIGTTVNAQVVASIPSVTSNAAIGTKLTLIAPIVGVQSQAVIVDDGSGNGLSGGVDTESDDDLRGRVLTRIQQPPQGGADYDYVAWAEAVPGVAKGKVWVYPLRQGLGTVGVSFLVNSGAGYTLPSAIQVAAVQAYIDARRPVTAQVIVFAPVAFPVNLTIHLTPDSVATRAAVTTELQDFFAREAEPETPVYLSRLQAAISAAAGEDHHILTSPVADVSPPTGRIPTLGVITWA